MRVIELKVKRLTDTAKLPTKAHETDAGWDLYADETVGLDSGGIATISLGIAAEIPEGYFALVRDRSSFGSRGITCLAGCIDAGYRGEWRVVLYNAGEDGIRIDAGDRIAQALILPVPNVVVTEVGELAGSPRGEGGFGSTGK